MKNYIDLASEARYWKKQAQQTDVRSDYYNYAAKRYSELNEQIKQMAMSQERVTNNSQIGNYTMKDQPVFTNTSRIEKQSFYDSSNNQLDPKFLISLLVSLIALALSIANLFYIIG